MPAARARRRSGVVEKDDAVVGHAERDAPLLVQLALVEAERREQVARVDKAEEVEDHHDTVDRVEAHAARWKMDERALGQPAVDVLLAAHRHVHRSQHRDRPSELVDQRAAEAQVALCHTARVLEQRREGLDDYQSALGWRPGHRIDLCNDIKRSAFLCEVHSLQGGGMTNTRCIYLR